MKTERLQGDYVLLRADNLNLLVSQETLTDIHYLHDRRMIASQCITHPQQLMRIIADAESSQTPTFTALSASLTLLPEIPQSRFVATEHSMAPGVQWCWNDVRLLNKVSLPLSSIPMLLKTDISPVQAVVTLDNAEHVFFCQFAAILHYLDQVAQTSAEDKAL